MPVNQILQVTFEFKVVHGTIPAPSLKYDPLSMIKKLKTGEYRLYSRKVNPNTRTRKSLGTFETREAAQKHERAVQFFKRAR